MNVQPMYFGESAPKHLRGAVSLSSAVFTAFGVVLGQIVGLRYGQDTHQLKVTLLPNNLNQERTYITIV